MANKFLLVPKDVYHGLKASGTSGSINLNTARQQVDNVKSMRLGGKNLLYNQALRRYLKLLKDYEDKPVKVEMVATPKGAAIINKNAVPKATQTGADNADDKDDDEYEWMTDDLQFQADAPPPPPPPPGAKKRQHNKLPQVKRRLEDDAGNVAKRAHLQLPPSRPRRRKDKRPIKPVHRMPDAEADEWLSDDLSTISDTTPPPPPTPALRELLARRARKARTPGQNYVKPPAVKRKQEDGPGNKAKEARLQLVPPRPRRRKDKRPIRPVHRMPDARATDEWLSDDLSTTISSTTPSLPHTPATPAQRAQEARADQPAVPIPGARRRWRRVRRYDTNLAFRRTGKRVPPLSLSPPEFSQGKRRKFQATLWPQSASLPPPSKRRKLPASV